MSFSTSEMVETKLELCMEAESSSEIKTEESPSFLKSKALPGLSMLLQEQRIHAVVPSVGPDRYDAVIVPASSDSAVAPTSLNPGLFPTLTMHSTASHSPQSLWQFFRVSNTPTTTIHITSTTPTPVIYNALSPVNMIESLNVVGLTRKALTLETTWSVFSGKIPVFYIPRFSNLCGLTTIPDDTPLTLSYKQNSEEDDISTENVDLDLQHEEQKIEDNLDHHETTSLPHHWGQVPSFYFKMANPIFPVYNSGVRGSYVGLLSTLHVLRKGGFA
ncbi:uncharacterized protein LOC143235127 [Tachypleus tridentatus]|uniref:uncharacterized protein LOC143235127 n=1 Tax=Tachypleus tridentatus TaxID=6853 RepID=UPI003FCF31FD